MNKFFKNLEPISLPLYLREYYQNYFKADLRKVQLFIGEKRYVSKVRAFTLGNRVYFDKRYWSPRDLRGQKLLAHEFAHVIQQNDEFSISEVRRGDQVDTFSALEREANLAAAGFGNTGCFLVQGRTPLPFPQAFDPEDRNYIVDFRRIMSFVRSTAVRVSTVRVPDPEIPVIRRHRSPPGLRRRRIPRRTDWRTDPEVQYWMNYEDFVYRLGGWRGTDYADRGATPEYTARMRYFYTRRRGLIDITHFFQLMYRSMIHSRLRALAEGDIHEQIQLLRMSPSAYSPEDMMSNLLGATFGQRLRGNETAARFCWMLESYWRSFGPVNLSELDIDAVVDWYSDRSHRGVPNWDEMRRR